MSELIAPPIWTGRDDTEDGEAGFRLAIHVNAHHILWRKLDSLPGRVTILLGDIPLSMALNVCIGDGGTCSFPMMCLLMPLLIRCFKAVSCQSNQTLALHHQKRCKNQGIQCMGADKEQGIADLQHTS